MTGDNPDFFAYVLYYVSMIEARRGELELAVEKLEQARSADPGNELEVDRHYGTRRRLHQGRQPCHRRRFLCRRSPTSARTIFPHGWLSARRCHRAEQIDQAREAYLRATELRPENPLPWHNLGLLASDQGKHEEAREYFQREVELAPDDAKAWYDLGVSLQKLGLRRRKRRRLRAGGRTWCKSLARRSSDLSAALSIVRRLNLGERVLKTE